MLEDSRLRACFEDLPDPRMVKKCDHLLLDIVMIAICATLGNADSWEDMAEFGRSKEAWFKQWLSLPNGIPSHDTFKRVFERLDGQAFQSCFGTWVREVFEITAGQIIAIDGKTARGTCDKLGKAHLQVVSAWASENGLTLAQQKVTDGGNEISTIPALLDVLILKGCIVTIDAIGCQKAIARQIRTAQADYVLMVKQNQPGLYNYVENCFQSADKLSPLGDYTDYCQTLDRGHGRHEQRQCWVLSDTRAQAMGWQDCQTLVRLLRTRQEGQATSTYTSYYISTLPPLAALLLGAIRGHWAIENSCHWVLDMIFHEDAARTRTRHADLNLALLRKFALNMLKQDPRKGSLKLKRYRASLNEDFLTQVLTSSFNLMR
ncbi:MAG TPA: ISAs1 family transposase [Aggregatilineales bacterium]|nr:ISAs1 family transposase [Aggregatilineales bacterium]